MNVLPDRQPSLLGTINRYLGPIMLLLIILTLTASDSFAHGVSDDDKAFIVQSSGMRLLPFIYLGAKHMVTGYDHLLFLFGVIFFLYRMRDVGAYVTLFAVGHSVTLIYGVMSGTNVNPYIVDAIIGLSVVCKALDNLGAFKRLLGLLPNCNNLHFPKRDCCQTSLHLTLGLSLGR